MKKVSFVALLAVSMVFAMSGCQTGRHCLNAPAIVPGADEQIAVDSVIVLVDSSGSMGLTGGFCKAKAIANGFISAMPEGNYKAGLSAFGGEWEMDWTHYPLRPFDRAKMTAAGEKLHFIAGGTPLAQALALLQPELRENPGKAAIVIISDGKACPVSTLGTLENMIAEYKGALCLHTVLTGHDKDGAKLMEEIAALSGCGTYRTACSLPCKDSMAAFVREVLLHAGDGACGLNDEDCDGVPNDKDKCPKTPKGARVDENGCWVLSDVLFDFDKASIRAQYLPLMDEIATVFKNNPEASVRIEGHTDAIGTEAYNQKLSERRAESVRAALTERGVCEARLSAVGFGESKPVAPNDTKENRQKNRRVVLSPAQ